MIADLLRLLIHKAPEQVFFVDFSRKYKPEIDLHKSTLSAYPRSLS